MNLLRRVMVAALVALLLIAAVPVAMGAEMEGTYMSSTVDYSELEHQLAMAGSLKSYNYTSQSWTTLKKAMDTGARYVKGRYGQPAVDKAAEAIEKAMTELVKMDYSQLETMLTEVYSRIDDNPELYDVWTRLNAAEAEARPLLVSGDQEAVNNAAEELRLLLDELYACGNVEKETEIVIQEVEVEVLPTDDYCNIPGHRTWAVLFAGSAVLNVALVIVLTYVIARKRKTADNTPLVSYDIDDDIDF